MKAHVLAIAFALNLFATSSVFGALPLENRGGSTFDPNTGLEWLDLSFTSGRSYNDVLNGWNGYTTSSGYRFATRGEILALFNHFGANPLDAQANLQAAGSALLLLGTTEPSLQRSWMHYDPASEPSLLTDTHSPTAVFGMGEIGGGTTGVQGFFSVPGLLPLREYSSPEIASALVRVVPEPSTFALLVLGCVVAGLLSRARGAS